MGAKMMEFDPVQIRMVCFLSPFRSVWYVSCDRSKLSGKNRRRSHDDEEPGALVEIASLRREGRRRHR